MMFKDVLRTIVLALISQLFVIAAMLLLGPARNTLETVLMFIVFALLTWGYFLLFDLLYPVFSMGRFFLLLRGVKQVDFPKHLKLKIPEEQFQEIRKEIAVSGYNSWIWKKGGYHEFKYILKKYSQRRDFAKPLLELTIGYERSLREFKITSLKLKKLY